MYRKAGALQVDDLYEYWDGKIPYSARVLSSPLILDDGVVFKALVKGGEVTIEMRKDKNLKLLGEDDDHFSNIRLIGQKAPTLVRGVPID